MYIARRCYNLRTLASGKIWLGQSVLSGHIWNKNSTFPIPPCLRAKSHGGAAVEQSLPRVGRSPFRRSSAQVLSPPRSSQSRWILLTPRRLLLKLGRSSPVRQHPAVEVVTGTKDTFAFLLVFLKFLHSSVELNRSSRTLASF